MTERSNVSRVTWIYRRCGVLFFTVVVTTGAGEQTLAMRRSSTTADHSQQNPSSISNHNALAPSEDNSTASPSNRGQVQVESNGLTRSPVNTLILEMIEKMPNGGDYRASSESMHKLEAAIKDERDYLVVDAAEAKPSFCSSATYLVFVSTLEELNRQKQIKIAPGVVEKLLVRGQHDGVGVWGRWNANGPGTARLFEELQLGRNFTSIDEAEPGDFLKIFWNDQIGSKEFGHSVVYLGRGSNGEIKYWSSNKKGGYGRAEAPLSKIKRTLFSHLSEPGRINQILYAPETESYLASMLSRSSTPEKMYEMVGITGSAAAEPTPASSVGSEVKVNGTDSKVGQKRQK